MTHEENDTDALGALLTAAAPRTAVDGMGLERLHALNARLGREVVEADRGLRGRLRRVRRRHRAAVAAAAAAVVLVPPGAWATAHFLAQTGEHGDAARNPGLQDGSELVDTCAADFTDYVATLAPTDLPAPPGHSWREYAAASARSWADPQGCGTGQGPGVVQETTLRLDLLAAASSDWGCVLVWADRDRERAMEASARTTMLALDERARDTSATEGSTGTWDPDVFLANSRLPEFTGCAR